MRNYKQVAYTKTWTSECHIQRLNVPSLLLSVTAAKLKREKLSITRITMNKKFLNLFREKVDIPRI